MSQQKKILSQTSSFQPYSKTAVAGGMMAVPGGEGAPVRQKPVVNNAQRQGNPKPGGGNLPDGRVAARHGMSPGQGPSVASFVQNRMGVDTGSIGINEPRTREEQHGMSTNRKTVAPPVFQKKQEENQPEVPFQIPEALSRHTHTHAPSESTVMHDTMAIHHVEIEELGAPAFVSQAEGISVGLPSQFAFYDFKDLFVYPLRGKHLAKLNRAHAEKSMLIMAEVISSVISTSDPELNQRALAFDLTLPDFYWILYYQRRNSFTKSTFTHTTTCLNPLHRKQVEEGVKSADTLKIVEHITRSMLTNVILETMPVPNEELLGGLQIKPATMGDLISVMEHPRFGKDPEFEYASQIACYLVGDYSFDQKVEWVDELTADQISAIKEYEKATSNYGIQESINVRCKECGASRKTNVSIDASTFLSAG